MGRIEANRRYRARLRGEVAPLLYRARFTAQEDDRIRLVYPTIIRGDGQMQLLMAELGCLENTLQQRATILGLTNGKRGIAPALGLTLSRLMVQRLATNPESVNASRVGISTAGRRADLDNRYFRSKWEANYARFLTFTKVRWEYESKTFWFENIKRGSRSYTPDFYLPDENTYHEVKGWMDQKSHTKLKRMAKYYPDVKIVMVSREFFKRANKQGLCRLVPGWECEHKGHNL